MKLETAIAVAKQQVENSPLLYHRRDFSIVIYKATNGEWMRGRLGQTPQGSPVLHLRGVPRQTSRSPRMTTNTVRPIAIIAREILREWPKPHYTAKPYLDAMLALSSIHDKYLFEDASDIINRFLSNASTWRGDSARRLKAELNLMLRNHHQ